MSNKQITKKQHYIPRFLLRNFCGEDGKLTVYSVRYKTYSKKTPSQICYDNYLYETKLSIFLDGETHKRFINQNQLENELGVLEAECANNIRRIINRCNDESNKDALICSYAEKDNLLRLINNLYLRNPITMTEYSLDSPQPWLLSVPSIQEMKSLLNSYYMGNVTNQIISSVQKRVYLFEDILTTTINTHNLTFLVSKEKRFVFSNLPVFLRNTVSNSCILFAPISPNCCVHYFENKNNHDYRNNKITYISGEQAISLNCLLGLAAQQATKFLYAKDKQEIEETIKNIGEFL